MNESSAARLAGAIADAAKVSNTRSSLDERVQAVVRAARGAVAGFDQASVSMTYQDGPVQVRAASSDLVEKLDLIQYEAEEGPCFEAFTRPTVVLVPSMRIEHRWPAYTPRAMHAGVSAQVAVPLRQGNEVRGALTLYSTTEDSIDPDAPDIATSFATHVAMALAWARREEQLNEALATRKMIGQAIGVLMERYQINDAKAFAFLVRVSQTGNIRLRDVAHELVTQSDTRYTIEDL